MTVTMTNPMNSMTADSTSQDAKQTAAGVRLILASASPRRCELLRSGGYAFEVIPAAVPEPTERPRGTSPEAFAVALSYFKARAVAKTVGTGLILAGDTVVALGDVLFGKPLDRDDARRILDTLSGTTHRVITGLTLLDAADRRRSMAYAVTAVTMRPLRREEIEAYLDSGEWEGKAGAYGIQDIGDAFVERIEGSFSNVVGLPMELLADMLRAWPASVQGC